MFEKRTRLSIKLKERLDILFYFIFLSFYQLFYFHSLKSDWTTLRGQVDPP